MRKLWENPAYVAVLLFLLSLVVYRNALVGVPEADAHYVTRQRAFYSSDLSYVWESLSYNRTRTIRKGSAQMLFRPGTAGMLALTDVLLQERLRIIGWLSLVWHSLASLTLYLITASLLSPAIGLLVGIAFDVQSSGIELILWRHINPYLFSVVFFSLGTWMLFKAQHTHRKSQWIASGAFFFGSMLFHETATLLLPVLAPVAYLALRWRGARSEAKKIGGVFLWPSLLYWSINVIDLIAYRSPYPLVTSHNHQNTLGFPALLLDVLGATTTAFVVPFTAQLAVTDTAYEKREWVFISQPHGIFILLGVIFLLFIAGYVARFVWQWRQEEKRPLALAALTTLAYFLVMVVGVTAGRLVDLGLPYLGVSTYYFYLTNFLMWLMCFFVIKSFAKSTRPSKFATGLVAVLVLCQVIPNYFRIQDRIALTSLGDHRIDQEVSWIRQALINNPENCYAGSLDLPQAQNYTVVSALYRRSCTLHRAKPLALQHDQNGEGQLVELPPVSPHPLALDMIGGNFSAMNGILRTPTPGEEPTVGHGMVLSESSYRVRAFGVSIFQLGVASLVLSFQNSQNLILVITGPDTMGAERMFSEAGVVKFLPLLEDQVDGNAMPMELVVRRIGKQYYLMKDRVLVSQLAGISTLDGKVGLHDAGIGRFTLFSPPFIEEDSDAQLAPLRMVASQSGASLFHEGRAQ